jgi:hypothetical protein
MTAPQVGQVGVPSRAMNSLRKSSTSVSVPTVDRGLCPTDF